MSARRSLLALGDDAFLARTDEPIAHDRPLVAIVDRLGPRWAASALSSALVARGARVSRLVVTLRAREGSEHEEDHLRASAQAMPAALRAALVTLPPHDVLVTEGPAAVALLDARLAILASPGSVLSLPPDVRALRASFDLVLFAERAAVLDRIAAELWPIPTAVARGRGQPGE